MLHPVNLVLCLVLYLVLLLVLHPILRLKPNLAGINKTSNPRVWMMTDFTSQRDQYAERNRMENTTYYLCNSITTKEEAERYESELEAMADWMEIWACVKDRGILGGRKITKGDIT